MRDWKKTGREGSDGKKKSGDYVKKKIVKQSANATLTHDILPIIF